MSNRGINSCKLSAFFIFGLMLFAALFNNAALAAENDGKGAIVASVFTANNHLWKPSNAFSETDALRAGSDTNVLRFIYSAYEGSGDSAVGYDMRDTTVRVDIPDGWEVPDALYIFYYDGNDITYLYDTRTGTQAVEEADLVKRVEFEPNEYIKVKLSGELWGKQTGTAASERTLYIIFYQVVTPVPPNLTNTGDTGGAPLYNTPIGTPIYAYEYEFTSSSMGKNGTFIRLANQPKIRVGSILGNKGVANSRDTLDRKVVITPKQAFVGQTNTKFTLEFTAPGPIYLGTLTITPDAGVAPTLGPGPDADGATAADVYRVGAPGANVTLADGTATTTPIVLTVTNIDRGQKITVTYTRKAPLAQPGTAGAASFTTSMRIPTFLASRIHFQGGALFVLPSPPPIEGGEVSLKTGSGMLAISPVAVEAGSQRRDFTLTYTAYTDLKGVNIEVMPKGIVLDSTNELQTGDSAGYGYVSGTKNPIIWIGIDDPSQVGIQWGNIDLDKGDTLKATIKRVDIKGEADEYPWGVMVGGEAIRDDPHVDGDELPILSVTKTSGEAVNFEIVGDSTFPAGSEQTIAFRFTATSTAIRDGSVSLTIPEALGSAPTITEEAAGRVKVDISNGTLAKDQALEPGISGRTITVGVKRLDVGGSVTITYGHPGDKGKEAVLSDVSGDVQVTGTFKTSASASTRTAGTATVTIGNIVDGAGVATLSPLTVEAGSNHRVIEVVFVADGTMDGGQVSLEMPAGWGALQDDPIKRNYVTTRGAGVSALDITSTRVIATLGQFAEGDSFRFVIGGGTGGANSGVEVQDAVGFTTFTIRSDGDGDNVFAPVVPPTGDSGKHKGRNAIRNPDALGQLYSESENASITVGPGILRVKVTSALDGTGTVVVDKTAVRAAADDVALEFTYTPTQTIEDGELRFTVPSSWSQPQVEEVGQPGYTEVAGADIGPATDNDKYSVTVPIFSLDKTQAITIKYGATDTGRAMASPVVGTDAFKIEIKGHANGSPTPIRVQPKVEVGPQASGKGKAVLSKVGDDLHAGDMAREFTVVYTAAGQMVAGKVRLTVPKGWSAPTADNVTVMAGMDEMTATFDGQMATVDGVNLMAGGQVTFNYTGDVTPDPETEPGEVTFAVAVHGGLDSDSYVDVSGEDTMLTVDVGQARAGSGTGTVSPKIVEAGATGVNIQFTYTAVGWTDHLREFRVQVPRSWTAPSNAVSSAANKGTYTVVHRSSGAVTMTSVERLDPIGRDLVARVKLGGLEVIAGDQIIFTYENADTPTTPEVSNFVMIFDGKPIADSVQVRVQDSTPSALSLESAGTVSADEGAMPLGITVGLRDDAEPPKAVAMNNDTMVTLTSTSTTGAFSMMSGEMGTESITVTIAGGDTSTMAYYTDTTAGSATITATAPGLTMASQDVTVTAAAVAPDAVVIDSVMVSPALAMAGDMVTVSAMGSAGQMAMFSVGAIVTDKAMMEDAAGSYSGSFMVVADQHADGMYSVTVNVGTASDDTGSVTIDSTAPTVTVTAPESAANGDAVMISATVTDASANLLRNSVDVSMLDSTQTDAVALAMGDDGAYSATVTISDDNSHANGAKTITVTATDAAGNSGMR